MWYLCLLNIFSSKVNVSGKQEVIRKIQETAKNVRSEFDPVQNPDKKKCINRKNIIESYKKLLWNFTDICNWKLMIGIWSVLFRYYRKCFNLFGLKHLRGADRIWTGGYWCCRPLPYHLATAPLWNCRKIFLRFFSDSDGNRTRVTAVKGRCLNRLTTEPCFLFVSYLSDECYSIIGFRRMQALF